MTLPTGALVVVHLMTTLCAITLSEEIPLTCPDTARRELKDISEIYNCTPSFVPEEKVAICDGVIPLYPFHTRVSLSFKMLEEVPGGTAMCLGLQNLHVNITPLEDPSFLLMFYGFDFNPLLAVGVLTADHNTSKTNRSCSISLLSDVLNLNILSQFYVWDPSFWNFSSPLLGTQLNWIQSLHFNGYYTTSSVLLNLLKRLQNTSIHVLNVKCVLSLIQRRETVLLKDMPFLREMNFNGVSVEKFHQDSFLGMPEMEVLILQDTHLTAIPKMIGRMPNLKRLEIVSGTNNIRRFMIPTKELSTLRNLEALNLKYNAIYWISGSLPTLLKLRILNLDGCKLSTIQENDFVVFPVLEELTLSNNKLTHLKENTFRPLERLKILDLSFNSLKNWPVLNDFSFILLDMSHNLLSDVYNLGNNRTTVKILNISNNRILRWDDKHIFSRRKSLIPNGDQRRKLNMTHSEDIQKNKFTSDSAETGRFFKMLGLSTTQRADLNTLLRSGSKRKLLHRIPANLSVVNLYDQTKLSKSDNGDTIIVNTFQNTIGYSLRWVNTINISYNLISDLSETMRQSLEGIHEVDLGGNEFKCVDCRMIPFQKWLNTTSTTVSNLGTSDPLLCWYPASHRGTPLNLVQYDEEPCLEKILIQTTSLLTLIGVPVGVMSILVAAAGAVIYKFRSQIVYMLHLYKIRRRAQALARSAFNKHAFDAFICYSSEDRRFVLTRLVPLLEKGQERYCLCLHERDFPLGSYIVSNIVGSIQHSRKTILVLSENFIRSKWCNWELEMANHKMFNEDEHFVILIQLEKLNRNKLPRHLKFMMDTRTYLEWPQPGHNDEEDVAAQRLKMALGPSIFESTREKAPRLSELMEDY